MPVQIQNRDRGQEILANYIRGFYSSQSMWDTPYNNDWYLHSLFSILVTQTLLLGSRDGAVVRVLASHPCGSGSIPTRCLMWVEFVVGSRLAPRLFLRVLWFSSLTKTNISKFQFDRDKGPAWKPSKVDVASILNIFIYSFIYLFIYLFIHLFIHLFIY